MSGIVVDCHSHVFNAEDIPIDGFLKRRVPVPSLLTGVFSGPLRPPEELDHIVRPHDDVGQFEPRFRQGGHLRREGCALGTEDQHQIARNAREITADAIPEFRDRVSWDAFSIYHA
jgi:hypothetical protein